MVRTARDPRTFFALQRLEQGALQQLGDELLGWKYGAFAGLQSNGLNLEGKTRKGVPDSFVGASVSAASAAVEYTTQKDRLEAKLKSDYEGVRSACPNALTVCLCTNREIEVGTATALLRLAAVDAVTLILVDGVDLANYLSGDRRDLRERYLSIPLAAVSPADLTSAMHGRVVASLPPSVSGPLRRRAIGQDHTDRRLHALLGGPAGTVTLVTGAAGAGKSVWSARHAVSRARVQPAFWSSANTLKFSMPDPVGLAVALAAYGVSDAGVLHELVICLVHGRLRLFGVIDAIDEAHDYRAVAQALREFRTSKLAPHTDLVLTCRDEAVASLSDLALSWPELVAEGHKGRRVRMASLLDRDVDDFLAGEGATPAEARDAQAQVPMHLAGVPLFLRQSLLLTRSGSAVGAENFIDAFVDVAVRDICARSRVNGRGPTAARVRQRLASIAIAAIATPAGAITMADVDELIQEDGGVEGESTLVGRAIQAGLLEQRGPHVGFTHSLYLEQLASDGATSAWPPTWPSLATSRGQQLAVRIARFLHDATWLINALLSVDALRAVDCAVASRHFEPSLRTRLVAAVGVDFDSRFQSDRLRALRGLGHLGGSAAATAAATWWNALGEPERRTLIGAAADVFLRLQLGGAFEVIRWHHWFSSSWAWYEPSFIRQLADASPAFRQAIVVRARERLESEAPALPPLVTMLAMMGDQSFVRVLRGRVARGLELGETELRALIHANTEEAAVAYAEHVELVISELTEDERNDPQDARRQLREYRRSELILRGADIAMHPHDAFDSVIEAALESDTDERINFGLSYAERLARPKWIPLYLRARANRKLEYLDFEVGIVRALLKESSASEMVALYHASGDDRVRGAIVRHASEVPGPETEVFLLDLLARGEHSFFALQALGGIRAFSACDAVLPYLDSAKPLRRAALNALTRIATPRAVSALEAAVHANRALDKPSGDDEYQLIEAIACAGGDHARTALEAIFPQSDNKTLILRLLFSAGEQESLGLGAELALLHRVEAASLARSLGSLRDVAGRFLDIDLVDADLRDERLLAILLSGVDRLLTSPEHRMDAMYVPRAIARFDLPAARERLRQLAFHESHHEASTALRLLAAGGDADAVGQCIDEELDQAPTRSFGFSDRLSKWPVGAVRLAVLNRLTQDDDKVRWLEVLEWFADDEDIALLKMYEDDENAAVADAAHDILRRRMTR